MLTCPLFSALHACDVCLDASIEEISLAARCGHGKSLLELRVPRYCPGLCCVAPRCHRPQLFLITKKVLLLAGLLFLWALSHVLWVRQMAAQDNADGYATVMAPIVMPPIIVLFSCIIVGNTYVLDKEFNVFTREYQREVERERQRINGEVK